MSSVKAKPVAPAPSIDRVVVLALSQVGVKEKPGNHTKYGVWFGLDGAPWCGIFASWCYGQIYPASPLRGVQTRLGFAGTQAAWAWAKKHGHAFQTPKVGDIVIWRHTASTGHCGIVTFVGTKDFTTVEGNTDPGFSRTGGMVGKHLHHVGDGKHDLLLGFLRPILT